MIQTTQMVPEGGGSVPVALEVGGTLYPTEARETLTVAKRDKPLRGTETRKELDERIREQFHARFEMDVDSVDYPDNDTLLEKYRDDIGLIRKACDEVCDVFKLLYRLNTRFEFQASQDNWTVASDDQAMEDEHYRNWSKGLSHAITIGDYLLSTRVTDLLREEGPQALKRRREECLSDFIRQLCQLLDDMVERQLVGLVVFGQDKDCDFHFFRDAVIEFKSDKQTMTKVTSQRLVFLLPGVEVVRLSGLHFDIARNQSIVRRTRQDIYLRDVDVAPFGRSRMPIPPDIHDFLTSLPEWLQNSLQIVEGDRYSQQFFDYEIEHVNWKETRIRPFHSYVVEDMFCDPALTLGHYVLAGWDSSDVADQRGQQEAQWQRSRAATGAVLAGSYGRSVLLASIVSLVLAMLALALLPDAAARIAGAAGITAFMACAVGSFHFSGKARHKKLNGVHHFLAAILSGIFAASMLCVTEALRSGNWILLWTAPLAPLAIVLAWGLREVLPDNR